LKKYDIFEFQVYFSEIRSMLKFIFQLGVLQFDNSNNKKNQYGGWIWF